MEFTPKTKTEQSVPHEWFVHRRLVPHFVKQLIQLGWLRSVISHEVRDHEFPVMWRHTAFCMERETNGVECNNEVMRLNPKYEKLFTGEATSPQDFPRLKFDGEIRDGVLKLGHTSLFELVGAVEIIANGGDLPTLFGDNDTGNGDSSNANGVLYRINIKIPEQTLRSLWENPQIVASEERAKIETELATGVFPPGGIQTSVVLKLSPYDEDDDGDDDGESKTASSYASSAPTSAPTSASSYDDDDSGDDDDDDAANETSANDNDDWWTTPNGDDDDGDDDDDDGDNGKVAATWEKPEDNPQNAPHVEAVASALASWYTRHGQQTMVAPIIYENFRASVSYNGDTVPVQCMLMEDITNATTLGEFVKVKDSDLYMQTRIVKAVLFQVGWGYAVMNTDFGLVHGDLHLGNILLMTLTSLDNTYTRHKLTRGGATRYFDVEMGGAMARLIDFGMASVQLPTTSGKMTLTSTAAPSGQTPYYEWSSVWQSVFFHLSFQFDFSDGKTWRPNDDALWRPVFKHIFGCSDTAMSNRYESRNDLLKLVDANVKERRERRDFADAWSPWEMVEKCFPEFAIDETVIVEQNDRPWHEFCVHV